MSMTGDDVKRDLDLDYRESVARGAKEMLAGQDEPTNEEILDLYPEIRTQHLNGNNERDDMSRRFEADHLRRQKRETHAAIVGMRLGVDPKDLLEIVSLLETMEA